MTINAIVFGATGMVGEGVLHVLLNRSDVESVLVIGRKTCGVQHSKLKELILPDFFNVSSIKDSLHGYNACYFCLGVSSIGMNEHDYTRSTYDLTMNVATLLAMLNPDMTFCYVSGEGTDSTELGRSMWARVKGKTENDLTKLPFKAVYNFRPGFIKPMTGMKNTLSFAKPFGPLFPVLKFLFASHVCTLEDLGNAMVNVTLKGYIKHIIDNKDIALISQQR